MDKIRCSICGHPLRKQGDIFVCSFCGVQYEKDDVIEMLQSLDQKEEPELEIKTAEEKNEELILESSAEEKPKISKWQKFLNVAGIVVVSLTLLATLAAFILSLTRGYVYNSYYSWYTETILFGLSFVMITTSLILMKKGNNVIGHIAFYLSEIIFLIVALEFFGLFIELITEGPQIIYALLASMAIDFVCASGILIARFFYRFHHVAHFESKTSNTITKAAIVLFS